MSELIHQKILQSIEEVPSLPLTALKIMRLANDINSPPQAMLETIKVDPVITAKVLQMINSSYFGLSTTVSDLKQALVMLGSNTIKNLALSSALLNTMKAKESGNSQLDLDAVWLHSLGVAVACKIVAKTARLPKMKQEEFFIIGLLHDIGRIFSFQFLADEYLKIIDLNQESSMSRNECEKEILSMTVPEAGNLLAEKWQLPENIRAGILYHREPQKSEEHSQACAIINVAISFVDQQAVGWVEGCEEVSTTSLELIGIELGDLTDPMLILKEEIDKAKDFIQE